MQRMLCRCFAAYASYACCCESKTACSAQAVNSTVQSFQKAVGPAVGTFDSVTDAVDDVVSTIEGQQHELQKRWYRRPPLAHAGSIPCAEFSLLRRADFLAPLNVVQREPSITIGL